MHRRNIDILVALVVSAVASALALSGTDTLLRVVVGLPLALFLPGYALTTMIASRRQGLVERVLLSFGLSIGIMIVSGVVLNMTPWGLSVASWTVLLSAITLIGCMVALLRRQIVPEGSATLRGIPRFREMIGFGIALCILAGAVGVARVGAMQQTQTGYTQVWMLPEESVPNNLRLGMLNVEHRSTTYEVRLMSGDTVLHTWPAITLAAGQRWETVVVLQDTLPTTGKIEAMVFRADAPTVLYRHVSLWPQQEQP